MNKKREIIDLTATSDSEESPKRCARDLEYPQGSIFWTPIEDSGDLPGQVPVASLSALFRSKTGSPHHVLLVSMEIDLDWLRSVIPATAPWTIVTNKGHGISSQDRVKPPIRVIQPPHYGTVYGTMHAKIIIIFYADRLRIIISTANLIPFDYESIQNMSYVQDFHKNEASHEETCSAMKDLVRFFTAMRVPSDLIDALKQYDLSSFKHQLVISIPGNYRSDESFSVGFVDLKSKLSLEPCEESDWIEYQCSSIGQLRSHFLSGFMDAVGIPGNSPSSVAKKLRILFPSRSTVMNGERGFSSVFLSRRSFSSSEFPRSSLYHAVHAIFPEVAMHTKMLSSWKNSRPQWLFIGSHNLSAAAWGCWTLDKTKFIVRNYEMGILFRHCPGFIFPYLSPPAKYSCDDLPWMQDSYEEQRS